jgi:hypothetical protein
MYLRVFFLTYNFLVIQLEKCYEPSLDEKECIQLEY